MVFPRLLVIYEQNTSPFVYVSSFSFATVLWLLVLYLLTVHPAVSLLSVHHFWCFMPVISVFRIMRQEDSDFKASLGYTVSGTLSQKQQQNKIL